MASSPPPSEADFSFEEPQFVTPRRRRNDDAEMDITPMIDITFLLLIFFVVASRMDPQAAIDLPSAKHGGAIPEKNSVIIVVGRTGEDAVRIYKGATKSPATLIGTGLGLEEREREIEDYVRTELEKNPNKKYVLVKAERGIKFRHIEEVRAAAARGVTGNQEVHAGTHQDN